MPSRITDFPTETKDPARPTPNTAVARSYGVPGIPIVEIQMSTWPSPTGKGKLTVNGIPRTELDQMGGIVFGVNFSRCDRIVHGRLVNVEKYHRRYGLALTVFHHTGDGSLRWRGSTYKTRNWECKTAQDKYK